MKRKDINPLLKFYDGITYEIINLTEANRVSVFRAIGKNEVQQGKKIFEFEYLPLLDIEDYNVLLDEYENNNTLIELYKVCSNLYFHLFMEAVQWYDENNKVTGAFDFKKQLEEYESKKSNDFSCPIIRYLDFSKLDNINFYKNLRTVISYSESMDISSVNELLYGTIETSIQSKRNEIGDLLINSVFNITYNRFKIFLETIPPQQAKTEKKQEQPKTFEELFVDANFISPCIDILKEIEPPLIDSECNYIGKSKGAFCVWIDEMQRQGIVKHFSDRKIFASLLPQKIKQFSIDESMFGKPQVRAETKYRTDIKTLVSQIKLSQYSQKGKLGK